MNIYPSDTDVRQGFSSAESAASSLAAQDVNPLVGNGSQVHKQAQDTKDANSEKVAATADRTEAKAAVDKINSQLLASNTTLKIRVLDDSNHGVQVEIVDTQSEKVLRKIPQDELLKLSASIKQMTGVALNQPA